MYKEYQKRNEFKRFSWIKMEMKNGDKYQVAYHFMVDEHGSYTIQVWFEEGKAYFWMGIFKGEIPPSPNMDFGKKLSVWSGSGNRNLEDAMNAANEWWKKVVQK